jgi:hypothetical protein
VGHEPELSFVPTHGWFLGLLLPADRDVEPLFA